MKIGILTMHRVPNYGSFMQAYALKHMIESMGHEVSFVDFHVEPDVAHRGNLRYKLRLGIRDRYRTIRGNRLGHLIRKMSGVPVDPNRTKMFESDRLLGVESNYHYRTPCDVLVIGSDEVFNCLQLGDNVGFSPELFGYGAKAKSVVSYAASFGNTTLGKLKDYCVSNEIASYLNQLNAVSVRDENSADVVKALTGKEPLIHLDPVLVGGVEGENWAPCESNGYVVLYGYAYRFTADECKSVLDFAHGHGLEVLAVGEDQELRDGHIRCRPDEVIPLFSNADYVITDTFHGTIFSVVTHTPFLTIPRADRNGQGGNEQKLTYLLKCLDLESRMVDSLCDIEHRMLESIDFDGVDQIRQREARRSMDYLRNCFLLGGLNVGRE